LQQAFSSSAVEVLFRDFPMPVGMNGNKKRVKLAATRYDLGYFDLEQKTLQPLDNPFGTRLSPMS
jgi:hypothetical protein